MSLGRLSSRAGRGLVAASFLVWACGVHGAVGRLPGEFSVSPTGAAQYTIPINVAPGVRGLKPSLALTYNSQGGNGLAGIRWTVSGLSRISRCGQTIATAGARRGVRFDTSDQFCLDGQRLVLDASSPTGTYGSDGAVYRTEVDTYTRITSFGTTNGGPAYFKAQQRSGLTMYFGNTTDSRFTVTSNSAQYTRTWAVNQIQDKYNNSIRFEYYGSTGGYNFEPKEVRWTDHCASAGCTESSASGAGYKVVFDYEDRPVSDQRTEYLFGASTTTTKRLDRIRYQNATSGAAFVTVNDYDVSYAPPVSGGTGRSQLSGVRLCGASQADCIDETTFQWQSGVSGWSAAFGPPVDDHLGIPNVLINGKDAGYGDFDGDGRTDIVGSKYYPGGGWAARKKTATGFQSLSGSTPVVTGPVEVADFSGDGRADMLSRPLGVPATGKWTLYVSTGTAFAAGIQTNISAELLGSPDGLPEVTVADVNGDGYPDVVASTGSATRVVLNDRNNFLSSSLTATDIGIPSDGFPGTGSDSSVSAADWDGDGRDDLLVSTVTDLCAIRADTSTTWTTMGCVSGAARLLTPDINGDGLPDLLYWKSGAWRTRISTGREFLSEQNTGITADPDTYPSENSENAGLAVADYDGDGRGDFVFSSFWHCFIYISDGAGYSSAAGRSVAAPSCSDSQASFTARDYDGDGIMDLLWFRGSATLHLGPHADVVIGITDGLGNSISSIDYRPLSDAAVYSTSTADLPSPLPSATANRLLRGGPIHVVKSYTVTDGVGGTYTKGYEYRNGYVNTEGRGFLGFSRVRATDSRTGEPERAVHYRLDFPYIGLPRLEVDCFDNASCAVTGTVSSRLRFKESTWAATTARYGTTGPIYHQVYPTFVRSTEYDPDSGSAVMRVTENEVTAANWNASLGAPNVETINVRPAVGQTGFIQQRTFTYGNAALADTTNWCLGLPTLVSEQRTKPDNTTTTRTLARTYATGKCATGTETIGDGGADAQKQLVTTFGYNAYGNLVTFNQNAGTTGQDPVSQNTLVSQVTTFVYGAGTSGLWAQYQRTQRNQQIVADYIDGCNNVVPAVNRTTTYEWDYRLGQMASERLATGERISWVYDSFGRVTDEDLSAGAVVPTTLLSTDITYTACGTCFPGTNAKYKVRRDRTNSDGFWSEEFFDSYGRSLGTNTRLIDGREARQSVRYDARGRMDRRDVPYTVAAGTGTSGPSNTITITSDIVGRVTAENGPVNETSTGNIVLRDFAGLSVTVTDAESRKRQLTYDVVGNLVTARELVGASPGAGDSITDYEYTPFDDLSKITDAGDAAGANRAISTFAYDGRGFMVSRTDGDRGTWTYDYDPWGQLEMVSHARGSIRQEYDPLGQLMLRVDKAVTTTELTTLWQYRNDGLLSSTQTGSYYLEEYAYTDRAELQRRRVRVQQGSALVNYDTDYTFDANGRTETITYPESVPGTRFKARYVYASGYTQQVLQDLGLGVNDPPLYTVGDASGGGQAAMDALGRVRRAYFGSSSTGPRETYGYSTSTLRLGSLQTTQSGATGFLQNYSYVYDRVGNLTTRQDVANPTTETYTYDALNRLDTTSINGTLRVDLNYMRNGNIAAKAYRNSTFSTFNYGASGSQAGPHAVSSISGGGDVPNGTVRYDATGNLICRAWNGTACAANSQITWFSYNLPQRIEYSGQGGSSADFAYGPNRERVRQTLKVPSGSPALDRTTYIVGKLFEVELDGATVARYRSNVYFDGRLVYSRLDLPGSPPQVEQFYVHQDFQGSVDKLSFGGAAAHAYSFDPFGKRRNDNPNRWVNDYDGSELDVTNQWTRRGYTGHEHLDNVRLIHMNGRVQDPIWGRMLSPDPVIGDLERPQSLNPYSYVMNNPLSYADPSGFSPIYTGGVASAAPQLSVSASQRQDDVPCQGANWYHCQPRGSGIGPGQLLGLGLQSDAEVRAGDYFLHKIAQSMFASAPPPRPSPTRPRLDSGDTTFQDMGYHASLDLAWGSANAAFDSGHLATATLWALGGIAVAVNEAQQGGGGRLGRALGKLPRLEISASRYPDLAENIRHAQRAGHPSVLTHGGNAAANRAAALSGVPQVRGLSRDEYPFASSMEGGAGSWVGHIPVSQQQAQGGLITDFVRRSGIKAGDQYEVVIVQ